jgi:hypothetical protein
MKSISIAYFFTFDNSVLQITNTANAKKKTANEVRLFAEVVIKKYSNVKKHEANNASNSLTYFFTVA